MLLFAPICLERSLNCKTLIRALQNDAVDTPHFLHLDLNFFQNRETTWPKENLSKLHPSFYAEGKNILEQNQVPVVLSSMAQFIYSFALLFIVWGQMPSKTQLNGKITYLFIPSLIDSFGSFVPCHYIYIWNNQSSREIRGLGEFLSDWVIFRRGTLSLKEKQKGKRGLRGEDFISKKQCRAYLPGRVSSQVNKIWLGRAWIAFKQENGIL